MATQKASSAEAQKEAQAQADRVAQATANALKGPRVLAALAAVRAKIDSEGIAKERENTEGARFKFRGIDDVLDTFSGPLNAHKLLAVPSYSDFELTERKTTAGKPNYNSRCNCTITFTSLEDGSTLVAGPFIGEANDTQDKSVAKAQSIAFRIGMLLTFCVPLGAAMDPEMGDSTGAQVEGDNSEPRARRVEGELMDADPNQSAAAMTASQKRIIEQKMKNAGVEWSDLYHGMGVNVVDSSNYNQAMDWIRKSSRA